MQGSHHSMGDRKVRPNHHQILKCPRCESLNTKFCYYNNYNQSQPRHFCKGCRRYWTKGGLLRNILVGSGSRKPKRSNNKSNTAPSTQPPPEPPCSSESSTLTATESTSNAASLPEKFRETKIFADSAMEAEQGGGIFTEAESFTTSSTTSSNAAPFGFGSNNNINIDNYYYNDNMVDASSFWFGSADAVHVAADGGSHASDSGGFGSLDWLASAADQGLMDLPNSVDDQLYWTHTHWSQQDQDQDNPSLFHLP